MKNKLDEIFKIKNLRIGQGGYKEGPTGMTALIFPEGAITSVDVRGAAPGTREIALLEPENTVERIHSVVLAGGSAFGLDSMSGVVRALEEEGIGFDVGVAKVPIVTGAILFDLAYGDPSIRPDAKLGYEVAKNSSRENLQSGDVGAGMGANVGKIRGMEHASKSGMGIAVKTLANGIVVGAIVALNAWGDIYKNGVQISGTKDDDGRLVSGKNLILDGLETTGFDGKNTTIGAIVTNATITKSQAKKISQMAHDAYARGINPVHTMYDGDTIFTSGTCEVEEKIDINTLGMIATEMMEEAIHNAIESV